MVNNQLKKMGLFLGKKNSSLNQILLGRPSHWSNWLVNQVFVHPSLVLPEPIQSPSPELTYRAGLGLITMVFTVIVDSLLWIGIIKLFIYPLIKKIGLEASFIFFFTVRMSLFIYIYSKNTFLPPNSINFKTVNQALSCNKNTYFPQRTKKC